MSSLSYAFLFSCNENKCQKLYGVIKDKKTVLNSNSYSAELKN